MTNPTPTPESVTAGAEAIRTLNRRLFERDGRGYQASPEDQALAVLGTLTAPTPSPEPAVEDMSLDVWLRFPADTRAYEDDDDEPDAEANTYLNRERRFVVKWLLTAVGLISESPTFGTYAQASAWLIKEGFDDYSS